MRQVIKQEVLQRIKDDETLIFDIANFLGKKFRTVYQWVLVNHSNLTTPAVLIIIKERFGFTDDSQVLEESKKQAA